MQGALQRDLAPGLRLGFNLGPRRVFEPHLVNVWFCALALVNALLLWPCSESLPQAVGAVSPSQPWRLVGQNAQFPGLMAAVESALSEG